MTDQGKWPDSREFWKNKRVCVTAASVISLGSFVVRKLRQHGAKDVFVPRRADHDLVQGDAIRRLLSDARPDVLIHLAARVGGIGANRAHPAEFFGACPELAEGTTNSTGSIPSSSCPSTSTAPATTSTPNRRTSSRP